MPVRCYPCPRTPVTHVPRTNNKERGPKGPCELCKALLDKQRESDGAVTRVLLSRLSRAIPILVLAFALAGCAAGAAPAPTVRPLMVQVPVLHETPCPAPALTDPALPLAGLQPESPPADTMRAYAAAVAILKGAVRERDAVLAGCVRADRPAPAQAENIQ